MALSQCEGCPTQFAVGLPACPHCGCVDRQEVGETQAVAPTSVAVPADDTPAPPPARRRRATTTDGDSQ